MDRSFNITLTIMAHIQREEQAKELLTKLKSQGFMADITWDKYDDQWETATRSLLKGIDSDWHIVLEDDAIIGKNFYQNALKAIQNVPEPTLISFYIGTLKPYQNRFIRAVSSAKEQNASWLSFRKICWGVGIAINSKHIEPMLERIKRLDLPYDQKMGRFFGMTRRKVYFTFPSIVDHRDEESINKPKPLGVRKAHVFSDDIIDFKGDIIEV